MTPRDELREAVARAIQRSFSEDESDFWDDWSHEHIRNNRLLEADAALSAIEREHVIVPREKS